MSTLRIKIVYEDDIRMFKAKSDTEELLSKVILFVKEAHDIETFRLVFKDDEGDEITIVDDDDLKEALNNNNKKTTKLYVKTNQGKNDEEKESEEVLKTNNDEDENDTRLGETSEDFEETEDDENNNNNNFGSGRCKWLKFLDDISEDKELKEEFINFLTTFIVSLQNTEDDDENENPGTLNNGSELFIQALSLHPKLNKHPTMSKFVSEKLDSLFYQFPHLLNILKQINADDIPKFIDLIIDFNNNNKNSPKSNNFPMLPPFLFPFLGLFNVKYRCNQRQGVQPPPFGLPPSFWGNMFGGFHHRGRHHHGRHRHHRGRHGHGHGHHGHHGYGHGRRFFGGRGCGRRGGMRKQCGRGFFNQSFFEEMNNNNNNNFEKCKKHKDLRADIINENITLGKNAFVSGNQTLIKTWKMKNVGKKIIPANCTIQYFGRKFNLMIDGTKFELKNKEIQLNEEFEVSVVIKSPNENGKYKSKWKLVTPDGSKFGQPLIVSFIVNDFNDNNNSNNKELKQLRKEQKKNYKKQQKFLRKEEKIVKKEEKIRNKKEKLRNKREKLLQKLQLLEQQSNNLNNNNDDKDDNKEEIIEENIQNNNNVNSSNNNIIDLNEDEEEIIIIENEKENEDTNENTVTSEGDKFIYQVQLEQLKNMGFNDENQLKQLLQINNGSIDAVLNSIM